VQKLSAARERGKCSRSVGSMEKKGAIACSSVLRIRRGYSVFLIDISLIYAGVALEK